MLDTAKTPPDHAAFDAARCLRCLASGSAEKRACAAARLIAAGFDLAALPLQGGVRQ
jgi:hypothetical protein